MNAWQPISTAPKDGSYVDLWVVPDPQLGRPQRLTNCRWRKMRLDTWGSPLYRTGWVGDFTQYGDSYSKEQLAEPYFTVTHWMQVDPPTPKEGGEA